MIIITMKLFKKIQFTEDLILDKENKEENIQKDLWQLKVIRIRIMIKNIKWNIPCPNLR
jgi:hypothetical protein